MAKVKKGKRKKGGILGASHIPYAQRMALMDDENKAVTPARAKKEGYRKGE